MSVWDCLGLFERWNKLCRRAGAIGPTAEAHLAHLRSLDVAEILKHSSPAVMGPVADGVLLPKNWRLEDNVSNARCKSIMLGDTNVEALIFDSLISRLSQERLRHLIKATFSNEVASQLCHQFGFSQGQSEKELRDAFRLLIGAVVFQYPNLAIADTSLHSEAWKDNIFL